MPGVTGNGTESKEEPDGGNAGMATGCGVGNMVLPGGVP